MPGNNGGRGERSTNGNSNEDSVDPAEGEQVVQEEPDYSSSEEDSEYDEEPDEQRKVECIEDMTSLEKYFADLKEMLYESRKVNLADKLQNVEDESSPEYLESLNELERSLQLRKATASLRKEHSLQTVQLRYKEEERTAKSQFQEDCKLLMMERKIALEEKIRRMTEEKITAELAANESWHLVGRKRRNLEFTEPEKKRKPATISGPYIVYMLKDLDIMEDLFTIRRDRAKFLAKQRFPPNMEYSLQGTGQFEPNHVVIEGSDICCNGQCFQPNDKLLIETASGEAFNALITSISQSEVSLERFEGGSSKVAVRDIQKGLYTLKPPMIVPTPIR